MYWVFKKTLKSENTLVYNIVDLILHWLKTRRACVQISFHRHLGDIRKVWLLSGQSVLKTCGS
jgi:hypothetical protein